MNPIVKKTLDGLDSYFKEKDAFIGAVLTEEEFENHLEVSSLYDLLLENGKCNDIIERFSFLNHVFVRYCHLNLVEKGYIFSMIQRHNVAKMSSMHFTSCPIGDADVQEAFHLDSSQEAYELRMKYFFQKEQLTSDQIRIIDKIIDRNKRIQKQMASYIEIYEYFVSKRIHQEEDYVLITNQMMVLLMPDSLIKAFVAYYQSLDLKYTNEKKSVEKAIPVQQKEEKVIPSVSRTSLKKSLSEMSQKDFSYKNYEDLLKVLKGLNYPDEKNHEILKSVFETAQKDPYYYDYILRKAIFENGNDENLNDILFLLYNADHSDIEECIEILDFIRSICDESFQDIMKKDEYDLVRMRTLKN
ncbi:MAG: hypothetical protein IJ743_04085 [Bacilli bacterium]|nr:hypothetical protein [Bacilli bacterium]MBR1817705.1 hypothetical protein [Bacilli bacterium]